VSTRPWVTVNGSPSVLLSSQRLISLWDLDLNFRLHLLFQSIRHRRVPDQRQCMWRSVDATVWASREG
jgi:hypothetical protein